MDEKELEEWLRGRPPNEAAEIAIRSAARVLPFLALLKEKPTLPFSFLPAFRAVLSAVVVMRFGDEAAIAATGLSANGARRATQYYGDQAEDCGACICIAARSAAIVASSLVAAKPQPTGLTVGAASAATHSALVFRGYDKVFGSESAIWNEVENDIATWPVSGTTMQAALWQDHSQTNFSEADAALASKITRQTGDQDSFWLRWWQGAKSGHWLDWDLQREVALIPDEVWNRGTAALGEAIRKIEARYADSSKPEDIEDALARLPSASPVQHQTFHQAVTAYQEVLPQTLAQVVDFCRLEINRLQGRNEAYVSPEAEAEAQRQIRVLTSILAALERLQIEIPETGALSEASIVKGEKLTRLLVKGFTEWPRNNIADMTDSAWRLALVGGCAALGPMLGVSASVAAGVGVALFGGKKIADAIKVAKDVTNA
ncbi:MAG: hypothetical protein U1A24_08785 [Cypionkella sp.]|uniref:hypothetical protein n=1 Tax=Cypionkella sp. TaxID=2811411 RepID=UPI002ABB5D5C|nr:hypothetical protein [Cypionkella sp.]MDZ4310639.1 hypothetical protein [Cypionkella sp.]